MKLLKAVSYREIGLPFAALVKAFGRSQPESQRKQMTEDHIHLDLGANAPSKIRYFTGARSILRLYQCGP